MDLENHHFIIDARIRKKHVLNSARFACATQHPSPRRPIGVVYGSRMLTEAVRSPVNPAAAAMRGA
jgi:hypothetical protein